MRHGLLLLSLSRSLGPARSLATATATMYHAVVYDRRAPEGVVVVEKNVPKAVRRGHVLVRVKACGVNPVDAKYCVGDKLPEALPEGFRRWTVQGGGVGFDLAGVVEALPPSAGEACDGFRVGDAVFGSMPPLKASFAELAEVPTHQLAAMPEGLSFPEAAALPLVGTTAMQALRHRHGLSEGQRVLIIGASGGVGSVAVQVAKDLVGAGGHVAAVCSARNHEMVKGLGADAAYDYTQGLDKLMEELSERYREAPLDLVLDCVSSLEAKDRVFDYNARVHAAGILKRVLPLTPTPTLTLTLIPTLTQTLTLTLTLTQTLRSRIPAAPVAITSSSAGASATGFAP
uniref:Enoyl reductase (ER) domain-containing protein n=2 Tax=Phaeomonas parva TaxID=124430 RepID=A0A7S1UCU6_9STRA|mmetsp:Transcript_41509/g.129948  ORF Transcript_41509/g.129948 Transcript_41509/m.129948 type:complete len:344 (+) Transcript_41509:247-1278(+)